MVGPQSISDEDFAALMDETEDAINNLAHHHLGWTTGDRDDEIEGGTIENTSAMAEPMDETEDETAAAVQLTSTSAVDFTTADINITAEVNALEVKNMTAVVDTLEAAVETMAATVDTTVAVGTVASDTAVLMGTKSN
jgi:hypothetical protein